MFKQQRTIKADASISGSGLHTGDQTTLTFKPAPINDGIRFIRTDLPDHPEDQPLHLAPLLFLADRPHTTQPPGPR